MNYKVVSNNHIITVLEDELFPLYTLDQQMVQEISDIEGAACAACILHLSDNSQLPTHVLYEIAFYIQKQYPYLCIDWFTTFYYVEKESYLRTAFDMKEWLEGRTEEENDEESRKKRFEKFESYELVYDIDTVILKIVMMNIINNVIIK
jgi:hypothetical protein